MSKGKTTTVQEASLPAFQEAQFKELFGAAKGVAQQPFLPYTGPMVAGFSPDQVRQFHVTGKETIQMNTGYIDESFNEIMRQLMLSEQVWVYDGSQVKPITLNTTSLQFKTSVNDKLINYTIDFSYAFNKINDLR